MQNEPPENPGAGERPFTPAAADRSLAAQRAADEAGARAALEHAALVVAGRQGFRSLTVQAMLDCSGIGRSRFYALFGNKEECYASAYARESERLAEELLAPGRAAGDWLGGYRGALARLADFLAAEPTLARGLIVESHAADGASGADRAALVARLERAVEVARTAPRATPAAPPMSAAFVVAATEGAATRALLRGEPQEFGESIPDLVFLAVSLYFGDGPAAAAYREARRGR